jgi:hypothetical protein
MKFEERFVENIASRDHAKKEPPLTCSASAGNRKNRTKSASFSRHLAFAPLSGNNRISGFCPTVQGVTVSAGFLAGGVEERVIVLEYINKEFNLALISTSWNCAVAT